jgi:hypothetical protein
MPETQTTDQPQTPRPNLTLQDLTLVIQVLESGSQRGAWKVDELSTIGGLYDRISAFIKAASEAAQSQEPADPGSSQ